jgi:hypothetical protein
MRFSTSKPSVSSGRFVSLPDHLVLTITYIWQAGS